MAARANVDALHAPVINVAGRIDPGENVKQAAVRELIEETGLRARKMRQFLEFWPSPGFLEEKMFVLLAEGVTQGEAHPEEDEIIVNRMVPLPTAVDMVMRGVIRDAKTISSVLWLDATKIGRAHV